MFKSGNHLIVIGISLLLLFTIGSLSNFLPKILNSYYLASTGTVLIASGIIVNKRNPLDR